MKPLDVQEERRVETRVERDERALESVPFDKEFTIELACQQFATFVKERGVAVDNVTVKKFFSALAASRLLVLKGNDDALLKKFVRLLGEYFGTQTALHLCANESNDSLLYAKTMDASGLSAIAKVILNTAKEDMTIRIAAIEKVKASTLKVCLAPIIRYLDQPDREAFVSIKNGMNINTHEIPDTMWFIVTLAAEEKVTAIPKYILDMAAIVDLNLQYSTKPVARPVEETSSTEIVAENAAVAEVTEMPVAVVRPAVAVYEKETVVKTPVKKLTFSQYKKMVENAAREFHLEEVQWKRVDKLEEFVDACNDYSIENKTWQRMEKYVAVYLAAGGEAEEALDSVLANNLIYSMLPCVADSKKPLEEKFSATLETMFGEGHLLQTLKAVKDEGLGV